MSETTNQSMNDQGADEAPAKHAGGRPLLFKTVEELQKKIDAYFADCDPHPEQIINFIWHEIEEEYTDNKGETKTRKVRDYSQPPKQEQQWCITERKPYTITGLAVFLGTSRRTLLNYEERDGQFFHTIKGAKDRIEAYWELQLLGAHATGPIFNLKNNYSDWKDKSEQENSGEQKLIVETRVRKNVDKDS